MFHSGRQIQGEHYAGNPRESLAGIIDFDGNPDGSMLGDALVQIIDASIVCGEPCERLHHPVWDDFVLPLISPND